MARFDENAPENAETEFLDAYIGEENWTRAELYTMNQEVDGIAEEACEDMLSELRSDLPDSIFDEYKSAAKEQFKGIKAKKNTVLSIEKWLRIVRTGLKWVIFARFSRLQIFRIFLFSNLFFTLVLSLRACQLG